MKNKLPVVFFALGVLLAIPFLYGRLFPGKNINGDYKVRGNYDDELVHIDRIQEVLEELNSTHEDTSAFVIKLDSLLQYRFYHGTARYSMKENWIASLLGEYVWDDFQMIVRPNDLMKKKVVVCNQMAIVFQEVLNKVGIPFRSVQLNHHMLTEVFYEGEWHAFDSDYEPHFGGHPPMAYLMANRDLFVSAYEATPGRHFNPHFNEILQTKEVSYERENLKLARNLRTFHLITGLIANYGWILCFLVFTIYKIS